MEIFYVEYHRNTAYFRYKRQYLFAGVSLNCHFRHCGCCSLRLPWLLRVAALLLWLGGVYHGFNSIQMIYAPFSPAIPVIALQFAIILISIGWVAVLLIENKKLFWGGMAIGGLVMGGASIGSAWLLNHWHYADLFFRVLPPAMFSVLLIYETIRLRLLRRSNSRRRGDVYKRQHRAST